MPNDVKATLSVVDSGLESQLNKIRNAETEIERAAKPASDSVANLTKRTEEQINASLKSAQVNAQAHRDRVAQIEQETSAMARQQRMIENLAQAEAARIRAARQVSSSPVQSPGPSFIGARLNAGVGPFNPQTGESFGQRQQIDFARQQESAIAFERQLRRVSQGYDGASASAGKFHGVTLIGSQILRQFGVEGSRGLEIVGRQFVELAEQGKSFKEVLQTLNDSKLLGFTVLAAGVLAASEAIIKATKDARELQEQLLKITEKGAVVKPLSQTGGSAFSLEGDLKRQQEALTSLEYFAGRNPGRFTQVLTESIGAGGSVAALKDDIRELTKEFDEFNVIQFKAGNRENVFDKAKDSLKGLAQSVDHNQEGLNRFINTLVDRAGSGTLTPQQITESIEAYKQKLESTQTARQGFADDLQKINHESSLLTEQQRALGTTFRQLQSQLEDNPLTKFYDTAGERQRQFLQQFKDVPQSIRDQFTKLNSDLLALDIFKGKLQIGNQISDNLRDRALLQATGGVQRQQQTGRELIDFVIGQGNYSIEARRLQGQNITDTQAVRERLARIYGSGLDGRYQAEAIEQATRGLTPQQLDAANARGARIGALNDLASAQQDDFERQQRVRQIEDQSRQRGIQLGQAALAAASSPEQQKLAVDQILNSTRDIGSLNTDQASARATALQQSFTITQKVLEDQAKREAERLAVDRDFIPAMRQLTAAILKGINLNVDVRDDPFGSTRSDVTGVKPTPFNNTPFVQDGSFSNAD